MIYVATYVTDADLDDLRDSVRDADLEFIASFPCTVARTRDDALLLALDNLRADYIELSDDHDPRRENVMLEILDPAPDACSTVHPVHLFSSPFAIISIRAFDI